MIKYAILEDERFAYEEIRRMMDVLRPDYILQAWMDSVENAVSVLEKEEPDLILADVSLSDGLCFDVFEHIPVRVPVIFTTAYDEYALHAFKVNSVDYLLKPIEEKDLERALMKFESNRLPVSLSEGYKKLEETYLENAKKNRFLVSVGDTFHYIETSDIAFFYSEEKYVYLHTFSGKRYIVGYSLEHLDKMLDRHDFFRVSRGCIAHIKSVRKASKYFGSRLSITFQPECPQKVIVSRNRVADFLKWMDDLQK